MDKKELATIIISTIVLAMTASFKDTSIFYPALLSFLVIISANIMAKKAAGFHFETFVKTKFWTLQQYGFRKNMRFKSPIPMIWLPLLLALFTKGHLLWLAILEFDIKAKAERVAKKHGIYRFTEVTEWHMALIAMWGLIANLVFAIAGYILGFELFAKLSIYFIAWNIIPLARFDGARIFYASRGLWTMIAVMAAIVLGWGLVI